MCDPDRTAGSGVKAILEEAGYAVTLAPGGVEARELLGDPDSRWDALMVDLALADGQGLELVRWVRATPATQDLPVVAMTADTEEGRLELGGELRLVDWLDKPVAAPDLEGILRRLRENRGGVPHVLHVEDDEDLRHTIAAMAGDLAAFHPAATLEQARQALAAEAYDLILLDLGLPDGSGWDLLPELNELEDAPAVVIFSAHTVGASDARRVRAALLKSRTSKAELLDTLGQLLTRSPDPQPD